jgi:organic radical activating enzyme
MAAPNISEKKLREMRDKLNAVSPSFCLAKWLQVTIHLQNGQTHSCHHPLSHKIPLDRLKSDPSTLHNTEKKKLARSEMLTGARPEECHYCWAIEDAQGDNLSDRTIKSAQPWAEPRFEEVRTQPWDRAITPSYVEVSFGNECNLRCAYCAPNISSAIMQELKTFGAYSAGPSLEQLEESGLMPFGKDEPNPYVEAFWDWWPELSRKIKVFRITGGEPLLNENTFRFLEELRLRPMPELTLAINSNLAVPPATYRRFLNIVKEITENNLVKEFQLFTSVDTHGKAAEFIRFGLNYESLMQNARTYLDEVKDSELIFMSAYNAFSVTDFGAFLKDVIQLKSAYIDSSGRTRVTLDTPYLKDPSFLSCYVLTADFQSFMERDLRYLQENTHSEQGVEIVYQSEIAKFARIINWFSALEENAHRNNCRIALWTFFQEYESRKGTTWKSYVPNYGEFLRLCENLHSEAV